MEVGRCYEVISWEGSIMLFIVVGVKGNASQLLILHNEGQLLWQPGDVIWLPTSSWLMRAASPL